MVVFDSYIVWKRNAFFSSHLFCVLFSFFFLFLLYSFYDYNLYIQFTLMNYYIHLCRIFSGFVCVCCIYILYLLNNVINLIQLIGPDFNNIYSLRQFFASFCVVFCSVSRFFCFNLYIDSLFICYYFIYFVAAFPYIRLRSRDQIFRGRICFLLVHFRFLICIIRN